MNKPLVTSRSTGPFIFFCVGLVPYLLAAFHLLRESPMDVLLVVLYLASGIVLLAAVYITSCTYDLYEEHIVKRRVFGLMGSEEFRLSALRRARLKTDYTHRVSAMTLEFEAGRRLRLHKYQGRFMDVVQVLRQRHQEKFADVS